MSISSNNHQTNMKMRWERQERERAWAGKMVGKSRKWKNVCHKVVCQSITCVCKSCVWQCCVCVKELCVKELHVKEFHVKDVLRVKDIDVYATQVSVKEWCVKELCVCDRVLCVKDLRGHAHVVVCLFVCLLGCLFGLVLFCFALCVCLFVCACVGVATQNMPHAMKSGEWHEVRRVSGLAKRAGADHPFPLRQVFGESRWLCVCVSVCVCVNSCALRTSQAPISFVSVILQPSSMLETHNRIWRRQSTKKTAKASKENDDFRKTYFARGGLHFNVATQNEGQCHQEPRLPHSCVCE